ATIDMLPRVVAAVAGRVPVLFDGGVRRGVDVVKALALGATAVMIGRPYLWGLGAAGADGAARVIRLLAGGLERARARGGGGARGDGGGGRSALPVGPGRGGRRWRRARHPPARGRAGDGHGAVWGGVAGRADARPGG